MVTNSFGKRNFMQPMGRHSRWLAFFPLKFRGQGCFFFFFNFLWFPICSHSVPFKFSMGSNQVLNIFPKFPMCSPTCSPPYHSSLLAHVLWQVLSTFDVYRWAKREEPYTSNRTFYFGEPP